MKVTPGYSGGTMDNPDYKSVCSGETGHAECLEVVYDPSVISFDELLEVFFKTHDPTTLNRQGNDVGTQYRSVIFYRDEKQLRASENFINELKKAGAFKDPIVTTLEPFTRFYPAEDYHRQYFELNGLQPYCHFVVRPKVEKFMKEFKSKLENEK